jgi:hypothetical protein
MRHLVYLRTVDICAQILNSPSKGHLEEKEDEQRKDAWKR